VTADQIHLKNGRKIEAVLMTIRRTYWMVNCWKTKPASETGCLQLLEIPEIYWNLKTLLAILEISLNLMVLLEIFV